MTFLLKGKRDWKNFLPSEKVGMEGSQKGVTGKPAGIHYQGLGTMICALPKAAVTHVKCEIYHPTCRSNRHTAICHDGIPHSSGKATGYRKS